MKQIPLNLSLTRFLWSTLFILISFHGFTQLKIVKDNLNCVYGLKNEAGEWIVPASYSRIEVLNNHNFKVTHINAEGIIDKNGKIIIPVIYDRISDHETPFYFVTKNKKQGLLGPDGTLIFPVKYTNIRNENIFSSNTSIKNAVETRFYLYETINENTVTTYADTSGKIWINQVPGYIFPFGKRDITPIGLESTYPDGVSGSAGLIDKSGKIIQPRIYTKILICDDKFMIQNGKKTGFIDFQNKLLLKPEYQISLEYSGETPCLQDLSLYLIKDGAKTGVIRGDMKIMLDPIYEKVNITYLQNDNKSPIPSYFVTLNGKKGHILESKNYIVKPIYDELNINSSSDSATYSASLNGKWGILSKKGYITIPLVYDKIISYKESNAVFFCLKNGKYRLLNDRNKPVVPFDIENYSRLEKFQGIFFLWDGANLYAYDQLKDSLSALSLISRIDSLRLYRWNNGIISFVVPMNGKSEKLSFEKTVSMKNNLFHVQLDNKAYLFNSEGKQVDRNNIIQIHAINNTYCELRCKFNKTGLMNLKTGKLSLDTVYTTINYKSINDNLLWVLHHSASMSDHFGKWIPMDTNGNRKGNITLDLFTWGKEKTGKSNGLLGMFNDDYEWVVQPRYLALQQIGPEMVVVYTTSLKYGVVNFKNQFLVDTVYGNLTEIYENNYSNWKTNDSVTSSNRSCWLFQQEDQQLLFYNDGSSIKSSNTSDIANKSITDALMQFAFRSENQSKGFTVSFEGNVEYDFQKSIFKEAVYNHFYKDFSLTKHCNFTENCPPHEVIYQIDNFGAKFCSFGTKENPDKLYKSWKSKRKTIHENILWRKGQVETVSLLAIFGNGKLLETILKREIEKDNLEIDCSDANQLVSLISHFKLSDKGIYVFLQDIYICIPISELKKHSESRWIVSYLK